MVRWWSLRENLDLQVSHYNHSTSDSTPCCSSSPRHYKSRTYLRSSPGRAKKRQETRHGHSPHATNVLAKSSHLSSARPPRLHFNLRRLSAAVEFSTRLISTILCTTVKERKEGEKWDLWSGRKRWTVAGIDGWIFFLVFFFLKSSIQFGISWISPSWALNRVSLGLKMQDEWSRYYPASF